MRELAKSKRFIEKISKEPSEPEKRVEETTADSVWEAVFPDLSVPFPFGFGRLECGSKHFDSTGFKRIRFKKEFKHTPFVVKAVFSYMKIEIPWFRIDHLHILSIHIPYPAGITWHTFYLPGMTFLTNVTKSYIDFFNVLSEGYINYIALGLPVEPPFPVPPPFPFP